MSRYRLLPLLILSALALSIPATISAQESKDPAALPPDKAPISDLLAQADAISEKVAQIRGLKLKSPLNKGVRNRQELRETLLARVGEEYSDQDIAHEAMVLKQLHLLPQSLDYKQTMIDLLTEQIAGFYDQKSKELYIMQGLPEALQRPTMAHEIFHAVQDQHFDILAMQSMFKNKDNGDFQLARSALLEGDATVLMLDFTLYEAGSLPQEDAKSIADNALLQTALSALGSAGLDPIESLMNGGSEADAQSSSAMSRAPRIIREQLVFPYLAGTRFVLQARQDKTWDQFDKIYADAPVSTEQILHPDRYFAKDEPTLFELDPSTALKGATKIYDNVFGEYQLGLMLKIQLNDPLEQRPPVTHIDPSEAAKGWGGDRMLAYKLPSGQVVLVQISSWDTPKDATQYYKAIQASIERRQQRADANALTKSTAQAKFGQATCYSREDATHATRYYVEQWGDLVLYIDGVPEPKGAKPQDKTTALYQVRDAVWDSLKRVPFAQVRNAAAAAASTP